MESLTQALISFTAAIHRFGISLPEMARSVHDSKRAGAPPVGFVAGPQHLMFDSIEERGNHKRFIERRRCTSRANHRLSSLNAEKFPNAYTLVACWQMSVVGSDIGTCEQ